MAIRFFNEQINFNLKKKKSLKSWIKEIVTAHNTKEGELNFIFSTDDYILHINKEYLNHDYYTDIITFDQSEDQGTISGDIYISIDRIKDNAENSGVDFTVELRRVMIHGVLHLIGYSDKSKGQQAIMREKEDACLSLYRDVPRGTL